MTSHQTLTVLHRRMLLVETRMMHLLVVEMMPRVGMKPVVKAAILVWMMAWVEAMMAWVMKVAAMIWEAEETALEKTLVEWVMTPPKRLQKKQYESESSKRL